MSVRKFTTDNFISVEFDPFGFSMKDLQTGKHLMRYDNRGELYPITTKTTINQVILPSTFASLAPSLWHERLGHLGATVFYSLG